MSSEPRDAANLEDEAETPEYASGGASQPRVAVDVLLRDQRRVLFDGDTERNPPLTPVTDPFPNRRAVLNWWQAACVRTLGHLEERLPAPQIVRDDALTAALTATEPTAGQRHERERLRDHMIAACRSAYRELEPRAHEYLPGGDGPDGGSSSYSDIDPEEEQHLAMRPAFSRLDAMQARTLRQLWGGFRDRSAVVEWTHGLPAATDFSDVQARHDVGNDVTTWLVTDPTAVEYLTGSGEAARAWRERFAATILLPAFGTRAASVEGGPVSRSKPAENPWNEVRD